MYMNANILMAVLAAGAIGVTVTLFSLSDEEGVTQNENIRNEEIAREATLPSDLPENIPFYPGATLKSVQDIPHETARNITLTLETTDSVADVNTWYRGALSQNAWAVTSDKNVGGYILLKGENENVAVFTQAANRSDINAVIITQRIQIK